MRQAKYLLNYFGHCNDSGNSEILCKYIREKKCKLVIEVGTYLGRSTTYMGHSLPEDGKIITIDNFAWKASDVPAEVVIYDQCVSNIIHEGLGHKITVLKMDHLLASSIIEGNADLIYIDGEHSESACYRDLVTYYPLLRDDGMLCGDDWALDTVNDKVTYIAEDFAFREVSCIIDESERCYTARCAVKRFAAEKGFKIFAYKNFWQYDMTKK